MSPTTLMGVQFTLSLVLAGLVATWYVMPTLNARPTPAALAPLFLVHGLRYLPSSAFAPGQVAQTVPMHAMKVIAYGDLTSAVLAIVAAVFLYYRWRGAISVAWIVNIVTSLDWVNGSYVAASNQLVSYPMGGNWYIINYYVPLIGVVHVMIFARLLRERTRSARAVDKFRPA